MKGPALSLIIGDQGAVVISCCRFQTGERDLVRSVIQGDRLAILRPGTFVSLRRLTDLGVAFGSVELSLGECQAIRFAVIKLYA